MKGLTTYSETQRKDSGQYTLTVQSVLSAIFSHLVNVIFLYYYYSFFFFFRTSLPLFCCGQ
jgi:hypothetical protein